MREIKFRAKLLRGNQWGFGSLIQKKKNNGEIYYDMVLLGEDGLESQWCINQDTIGQFTGLYDKNSKEIYEGDVVKTNWGSRNKVIYANAGYGWFDKYGYWHILDLDEQPIEIIGNIHDREVNE